MPVPVSAYLFSLGAVAVAALVRWALDPALGDALPFTTFFGALAVAVWFGGYAPAIVAAVAGYLAANYLFIAPRFVVSLGTPSEYAGLAAYAFTCVLIIGFGQALRAAQRRTRVEHELLQVTVRSIGDAVVTTDMAGRIAFLNPVAEALTGWSLAEAQGRPLDEVFRIVNEKTRVPVDNPAMRALREGVVVGLANHTILLRKDGSERPIEDSAAPIRDDSGRVSGCVLVFRDATAGRRIEEERAQRLMTARTLASIVESSDDGIVRKSLDGIIESWNAGAERIFGHPAAEAIGKHISLVIPPERIAEEDLIIGKLRAGERIEHFETVRMRRDGERIHVSLTISPVRDDAGRIVGASKIVRDITARKRVEADRERFVTIAENSTDFIGICNLEGVPSFINRAGLELVGLDDVAAARRVNVQDFFFPEDRPRIVEEFLPKVLRDGHGEIEVRFRHFKTHAARWMVYKVLTLRDAEGRATDFATVSQDVTERKRLEDELRQLAAELEQAGRRKDEFMATLAHELRNPLAPLANMLEVMKRAGGDAATLMRVQATMERQLGQMVRLVDDLLDLNRITHGRLELRQSDVELSTVLNQAIEATRPMIDAAGHALTVSLPAEKIWLRADAARLAQVFGNLLHNSAKYTNAGGQIAVSAALDGDTVVVRCRDNGTGIPRDKLDVIFEMFTQVDRPLERAQGGLGIGLTLVKRLLEMHGGTIAATSEGEGRGSEFIVRLPRSASPSAAASAAAPSVAAHVRRILIVDDNEDAAESLALLLSITGNETHVAHRGREALVAAERHRPEILLLDIGLPDVDGYDVCRQIRQQPWGRDIVTIALTGWGQEEDRKKSRQAGFDGHLVKPVDYGALMDLLARLAPKAAAEPV